MPSPNTANCWRLRGPSSHEQLGAFVRTKGGRESQHASAVARIGDKSSTLRILAHRCSGPAPSCTTAIATKYVAQAAVHEPSRRIDRIDWAEHLKRLHDVDALACPCGGRLKSIALILDEDPARRIDCTNHRPGRGAENKALTQSRRWLRLDLLSAARSRNILTVG